METTYIQNLRIPPQQSVNQPTIPFRTQVAVNQVLRSMNANSPRIKSTRSISIFDETLISIDPNSVSIQEGTLSHDNMVFSHVDMPSFAESEMIETSLA